MRIEQTYHDHALDGLHLPRRKGGFKRDITILQYSKTKRAKHIVRGEISAIFQSDCHSIPVVRNRRDNGIQGDLVRLKKICSFGLDDGFESTLVDAEVIMV
jgi:hypothetical protein